MLVVIRNVFESLISINRRYYFTIPYNSWCVFNEMICFLGWFLGDVLSSRLDGHTQTDVDMNKLNEEKKTKTSHKTKFMAKVK